MMITLSTKLAMDLMVLSFSTVVGTGVNWDPRIVTFPVGAVVWLYCARMHNCYQDYMYQPTTRINPLITVVGPFNVILHALSHHRDRTLILILLKFIVPFSVMWGRTHRFLCFDQYCGELKDTTRFSVWGVGGSGVRLSEGFDLETIRSIYHLLY